MRSTINREIGRQLRPEKPRDTEDININKPNYGGNKLQPTRNQVNPMYTMPSGTKKPMPKPKPNGPMTENMPNPYYGGPQINPMMNYGRQPVSAGGKNGGMQMQPSPYEINTMNNGMSQGKGGSPPPQQSSGKGGQQPAYQNSGKGGSSPSGGK